MERVTVTAYFHAGHRQINYPGKCEWVHGHTWRARIMVTTEAFPRDELDMSLDFADLKQVARALDHKMLVSADDAKFLDPAQFCQEGVVVIAGKGPSVENVARHIFNGVVAHIRAKYPDRGIDYVVEVELQETDNNFFAIIEDVVV